MKRSPRRPAAATVHVVTVRTNFGAHALRPSRVVNDLVAGAVGYAQKRYGVPIFAFAAMSNHIHFMVQDRGTGELARFKSVALPAISRELGRLWGDRGLVFQRCVDVLVSDEPEAQLERLCYVLAHGAKEGLVDDPRQWPGVHSARALLDGEELAGTRYDRTKMHDSTPRQIALHPERFAERHVIVHSQLPAFADMEPAAYRQMVARALADFLAARRNDPEAGDRAPAEAAEPFATPAPPARPLPDAELPPEKPTPGPGRPRRPPPRRRPTPQVHAASPEVRAAWCQILLEHETAYRNAAADFRAGRAAVFPAWCYPPGLPFVGAGGLRVPARASPT